MSVIASEPPVPSAASASTASTASTVADPSVAPALPTRLMPARKLAFWGLLAVIVFPHLYEVIVQKEHWPFSPYQMWSKPSTGWEVSREILRGVTDEPVPREVPLIPHCFDPIPYQMVVVNLQSAKKALMEAGMADTLAANPGGERPAKLAGKSPEQLKAFAVENRALADRLVRGLLEHYNNRLAAGKFPGPKLQSLRLYTVTWDMKRYGDDLAKNRQEPVKTQLVFPSLSDAEKAAAVPPISPSILSEYGDDNNPD